MIIKDNNIFIKVNKILIELYGSNAKFREGQYEAIESVFLNKRTLIVQKTGWGKSLVYFVATKLMREENNSPTIVISPLLVLMQNQIEMAKKLGLNAVALNSQSNKEDVILKWKNNEIDILFITPETLFSKVVQNELNNLKIGLFVIDEAHCISDWGHDFRLEYLKISEIINILPRNVSVLATTATATDRVIEDLKQQLGGEIHVSRGPLTRESLSIQVLNFNNKVEKYAWILENINKLEGSGIIYCLTKWDCEKLADFLTKNGINAVSYHADKTDEENIESEEKFRNNNIKVLVATVKLGMGYDKGDINFVIHFHMSSNIVAYYQQIGRAGRNIDNAYIFLLKGKEDEKIINYFIESAFPTEHEELSVYNVIANSPEGITKNEIFNVINIRGNRVTKSLQFLENDKYIFKDKVKYYTTPKVFSYDKNHYNEIMQTRFKEKEEMIKLTKTDECYSKYIVNSLDDNTAQSCGKCSNCLKNNIIPFTLSRENLVIAHNYLIKTLYEISPRKKDEYSKNLTYINEPGICLSKYGDYGIGMMVEEDKYHAEKYREEIIDRTVKVIKENFIELNNVRYITYIPSNNNDKVKELAYQIANRTNITFLECFEKNECNPQKDMENSFYQSRNAKMSYRLKDDFKAVDKIILIDDIVDSKWTMTWCGYFLKEKGVEKVYPFALTDSSNRRGDQ